MRRRRIQRTIRNRHPEWSQGASTDEAMIDWTKALDTGRHKYRDINYAIHAVYQKKKKKKKKKKNSKYDPYRESGVNFYYEKRAVVKSARFTLHIERL
jgi:hypothetical protein